MSSINEDFYGEVDNLFNGMKNTPFVEGLPNPIAQQVQPGYSGPVGWVQNADSAYGGIPTVVIDSDGITINNGRITLNDQFGQNVITGGGFGFGWLDFLDSGRVYNSSFIAGTLNNIAATTIVGTASTPSDYAASISTDIPYWGIDVLTAGNTLARIADSSAPSGYALEWAGSSFNAEIFQDIPIVPGQIYSIYWTWKYVASGNNFTGTSSFDFRDVNHAIIGGTVSSGLLYSSNSAEYITQWVQSTGVAPSNARYLRVYVANQQSSGTPDVRLGKIVVDPMISYGPLLVSQGDVQFDTTQGLSWATGDVRTTSPDIQLHRTATARVDFTDPGGHVAFSVKSSATPGIGFYGTAPVAKQTVSGSKGANAALGSLMTALANLGLVTNSTT